MFAFAIYDMHEQTLFLARDRIGKKPLKYFFNGEVFIFASELKAILTQPEVKVRADYHAISHYLTYGYVPSPLTGFENIKKLEPGSYISINIRKKVIEKKRYWQPMFDKKLKMSERSWEKLILEKLEESVELRMVSDVPVGAFLSGGTDSSAVVTAMANISKKPIDTFTVIFSDKSISEEKYARNISKKIKTKSHEIVAKPQSIEILPEIAYQYEEPFADNSSVVAMMVSKLARKYLKVVLNGDGGDEIFAGYPNRYFRLKRDVDYNTWITIIRPYSVYLAKQFYLLTKSQKASKIEAFLTKAKLPIYQRFASYNQIFSTEELDKFTKSKLKTEIDMHTNYEIVRKCFELFRGGDLKDAGLKFELMYWLPDDLLAKMDIATMSVGLEARSPLLDHEMIELTGKIPFNLKIKNGETKYIFKKALEELVPKENLYRSKVGFTIPIGSWFKGKLNPYAKKYLLSKNSWVKSIFDKDYIKMMLENRNDDIDYGPRIWSLLTLELWHRSYFN